MMELFDASAWMRLESIKILEPSTSPASTHWQTILSKKSLKVPAPHRLLALLSTLWSGISSSKESSQVHDDGPFYHNGQ